LFVHELHADNGAVGFILHPDDSSSESPLGDIGVQVGDVEDLAEFDSLFNDNANAAPANVQRPAVAFDAPRAEELDARRYFAACASAGTAGGRDSLGQYPGTWGEASTVQRGLIVLCVWHKGERSGGWRLRGPFRRFEKGTQIGGQAEGANCFGGLAFTSDASRGPKQDTGGDDARMQTATGPPEEIEGLQPDSASPAIDVNRVF
jgi:hypothetical protein